VYVRELGDGGGRKVIVEDTLKDNDWKKEYLIRDV
jgi:hypothetical protein